MDKSTADLEIAKNNDLEAYLAAKVPIVQHLARLHAESGIELGQHLSEIKSKCPHGRWISWIEENVGCSDRYARYLIAIYERFGKGQIGTRVPITKLKLLINLPENIPINQFIKDHDIENMSVRDLKETIKPYVVPDAERKSIEQSSYQQALAAARVEAMKDVDKQIKGLAGKNEALNELVAKKDEALKALQAKEAANSSELKLLNAKIKSRENMINGLQKELGQAAGASEKLEKMKADISKLKATRATFQAELDEIRELVRIKSDAEELLKRVAPVRYMTIFKRDTQSKVARELLTGIYGGFQTWMHDAEALMKENYIEAEVVK